jgi:hypothetical protein
MVAERVLVAVDGLRVHLDCATAAVLLSFFDELLLDGVRAVAQDHGESCLVSANEAVEVHNLEPDGLVLVEGVVDFDIVRELGVETVSLLRLADLLAIQKDYTLCVRFRINILILEITAGDVEVNRDAFRV